MIFLNVRIYFTYIVYLFWLPMTTITIDAPLNIKKTHFATARDAAEFLLKYVEKEQKKI